ncbi:MAG: tRNA pseudouridine(13) synthase TruD [Methylococcales bacterium]
MQAVVYRLNNWPRASGESCASVIIRSQPADFYVEETLGFQLSEDGEHVYLLVEKTGQTTAVIAERVAKFAQVHPRSVGYAGLKDRNAVTRQWFSVQLPTIPESDWEKINTDDLTILDVSRHHKKLRKGALKHNFFKLILREVNGDRSKIESKLDWIRNHGVPNYFGPQRFGRDSDNINQAILWLNGRKKSPSRYLKGLYLSSMRSFLFNEILAWRVRNQRWNKGIAGDIVMLNGSNACFLATDLTDDLQQRFLQHDIHPAGILYGEGGLDCADEASAIEQKILNLYPELVVGLNEMRIKKSWRSMRLLVANLQWKWIEEKALAVSFSLPSGSYATSVLAEL